MIRTGISFGSACLSLMRTSGFWDDPDGNDNTHSLGTANTHLTRAGDSAHTHQEQTGRPEGQEGTKISVKDLEGCMIKMKNITS